MSQNVPYVITISRQIGSGGAYIGQQVANKLGISYIDREIVHRAAQRLNMPENDLVHRDEKRVTQLWLSVLGAYVYGNPGGYIPPPLNIMTDEELYQVESEIILDIAKQASAVIIGRGGYYILRGHPRHLSIFLYADAAFRQQRIKELYHLSSPEALDTINSVDKSRASYLLLLTKENWIDARQYHISIDTSILGLEIAENIIIEAVHARFH